MALERREVAPARHPFAPEVRLVNRVLPPAPVPVATSAEGCASGDCLPDASLPNATGANSASGANASGANSARAANNAYGANSASAANNASGTNSASGKNGASAANGASNVLGARSASGASSASAANIASESNSASNAFGTRSANASSSSNNASSRASGAPAASPHSLDPGEGPPEPPDLDDSDAPPNYDDAPPAAAGPSRVGTSSDDDKWRRAVEALRETSPRHGKSLSYARFLGFTPEGVKLVFPQDAAFHRSQVIGMSRAMVEGELAKSLGRPIKLTEDTSAAALQSAPRSIAEVEASDRSTREKSIEQKVRAHPALKNIIRHLGGALEHIAYLEPVSRPSGGSAAPASSDEGDAGPNVD